MSDHRRECDFKMNDLRKQVEADDYHKWIQLSYQYNIFVFENLKTGYIMQNFTNNVIQLGKQIQYGRHFDIYRKIAFFQKS